MYEMMAVWETPEVIAGRTPDMLDFASGQQDRLLQIAGDRFYTEDASGREFHPQVVRELKAQSPLDISLAGPTLAAYAIRTGLVDEYHLLVVPTVLGGGTRVVPSNVRIRLDLLVKAVLPNGMVYLRYHAQE
jgi:riboflavin biosynthesis pyrimidine reductase